MLLHSLWYEGHLTHAWGHPPVCWLCTISQLVFMNYYSPNKEVRSKNQKYFKYSSSSWKEPIKNWKKKGEHEYETAHIYDSNCSSFCDSVPGRIIRCAQHLVWGTACCASSLGCRMMCCLQVPPHQRTPWCIPQSLYTCHCPSPHK